MTKKTVLGMPRNVFYTICSILVIGIIIGSFYDYQISVALSNKTAIGNFYQHYGNIISHLLYPVAGMCLFKGLRKKGSRFNTLAWGMLALPMLADVVKGKKAYLKKLFFAFAIVWIVVTGYNRIHMNAHFLTDVCFGVLITYCLYALTYKLFFSIFEKGNQ